MKSTGIVRRLDKLGRIVIPKELRRTLSIMESEPLEIYTDKDFIVFAKYQPNCIFCDSSKNVIKYRGKNMCSDCLQELKLEKY